MNKDVFDMTAEEWAEFREQHKISSKHPIHEYNLVEEPFRVPKMNKMLTLKYPDKINSTGDVFLYDPEAPKGSIYEYMPVGNVSWEPSGIDPDVPQMVGTSVNQDYANNGIGKQLYERIAQLFKENNIHTFHSDYSVSPNAHKLYKHLETVGYPVDQIYDKEFKQHIYRVRT